jgi:hypothetical protein
MEDLAVDGRVILKYILRKWGVTDCIIFHWVRVGD